MWRSVLLISLCLSACHRAPVSEAPTPAAEAPLTGEPARQPGTDSGETVAGKPGEAEDRCTRDEDCALTPRPPGECCPMLCTPRALSTAALARQQKACEGFSEAACAMPMCAPPRGVPTPVCQSGRCAVRLDSRE
jgi:hypothetical protein